MNLWRHTKYKKVLSPLPKGAQRRLKRQNTLSLRLVFDIKLFMMCCLLKSNFPVHRRFVSPAVSLYNLISFLVLCVALSSAALQYSFVSFLVLSYFFTCCSSLIFRLLSFAFFHVEHCLFIASFLVFFFSLSLFLLFTFVDLYN